MSIFKEMIARNLIILFLLSNAAVIAGYYNTILGIDFDAVMRVYKSIPIIKTSIFLTSSVVLNALIAFYSSKGNYTIYKNSLMSLSFITPFIVVLIFLPGEQDNPQNLELHPYTMLFLIIGSQLLISKSLEREFWLIGGRDENTH